MQQSTAGQGTVQYITLGLPLVLIGAPLVLGGDAAVDDLRRDARVVLRPGVHSEPLEELHVREAPGRVARAHFARQPAISIHTYCARAALVRVDCPQEMSTVNQSIEAIMYSMLEGRGGEGRRLEVRSARGEVLVRDAEREALEHPAQSVRREEAGAVEVHVGQRSQHVAPVQTQPLGQQLLRLRVRHNTALHCTNTSAQPAQAERIIRVQYSIVQLVSIHSIQLISIRRCARVRMEWNGIEWLTVCQAMLMALGLSL